MSIHQFAGKPAPRELFVNIPRLVSAYYTNKPDPDDPTQSVSFGTSKDGIILDLLAAEITATTGKDPGEHYQILEKQFGSPVYERMDAPATPAQK